MKTIISEDNLKEILSESIIDELFGINRGDGLRKNLTNMANWWGQKRNDIRQLGNDMRSAYRTGVGQSRLRHMGNNMGRLYAGDNAEAALRYGNMSSRDYGMNRRAEVIRQNSGIQPSNAPGTMAGNNNNSNQYNNSQENIPNNNQSYTSNSIINRQGVGGFRDNSQTVRTSQALMSAVRNGSITVNQSMKNILTRAINTYSKNHNGPNVITAQKVAQIINRTPNGQVCNINPKYIRIVAVMLNNYAGVKEEKELLNNIINEINTIENKKMKHLNISESELKKVISEVIKETLNESMTDEGFWNQLKSGINGARHGYQAQKTLDRGTNGFKQNHDNDDAQYELSHPMKKSENTAAEQANMIYKQYKEYQSQANKLLAKYNALRKQYGLVKQGVGQVSSPVQPQLSGGLGVKRPFERTIPSSAPTMYSSTK